MGTSVIDGVFRALGDGVYHVAFPEYNTEFDVAHVHRDRFRQELLCELSVSCGLAGCATDKPISTVTFNLSNGRDRQAHAQRLAALARARGVDWASMLEAVCQFVLVADRKGEPSIGLRDVPKRIAGEEYDVLGLRFPRAHPAILFGDGGSLKSYLELKLAVDLAAQGLSVGYFDWELDKYVHRERLEQIAGTEMPDVRYVRCDKPLVHELPRLRRVIREDRLDYVILDSAGFGTQGAPESAEAAIDYCRAVRQLGIGSNIVAHITKSENGDQRPFGSVFWHNSARATWYVKRAATSPDGQTVSLAAFHRKSNLGAQRPAVGISVQFDGDRVYFERVDVTTIDEVVESLPLWQRIKAVVKCGPQTLAAIASELNYEKVDSLDRVVRKHKALFTKVPGPDGITRIALLERRVS